MYYLIISLKINSMKKKSLKLSLNKLTITNLSSAELKNVMGGITGLGCNYTSRNNNSKCGVCIVILK
jgi:natural product precursor